MSASLGDLSNKETYVDTSALKTQQVKQQQSEVESKEEGSKSLEQQLSAAKGQLAYKLQFMTPAERALLESNSAATDNFLKAAEQDALTSGKKQEVSADDKALVGQGVDQVLQIARKLIGQNKVRAQVQEEGAERGGFASRLKAVSASSSSALAR